jgi:hypothetical protein
MAATAFAASPFVGVKVATRSGAVTRKASRATATPVRAAVSIGETFSNLKKRGQCAFVPFICAGDPNLDATEKALQILDEAGADVIELGVPYSDPLADGPTIQVRTPSASALTSRVRAHLISPICSVSHSNRPLRPRYPRRHHPISVHSDTQECALRKTLPDGAFQRATAKVFFFWCFAAV